ncbi:hypothetical protein LPJ64_004822 [Coemansia asiatica]|uniref:Fat storage-inducing transmembrane protein n=1 Tax=Coemansia asiatica TaxID=1052880 RepID=A0A9W8CI75_9FUNG|nr:hypothetical protein LPJ64_004822 [Coemansia asiatica]
MSPAMAPRQSRSRSPLAPAAVLAALLAAIVCGLLHSAGQDPGHMHAQTQPQPQPQPQPSLWASKKNPLNTYFAKLAWAWTTALFVAALPMRASPRSLSLSLPLPTAARALASYALATLYWVLMTQWFFGPSLFDRVFVLTGGACQHGSSADADSMLLPAASLNACRAAGGWWSGGHDVSGHCFLLLHSALFLTEEVLGPLLFARQHTAAQPTSSGSSSSSSDAMRAARRARLGVVAATLALVALWTAMLFSTAAYFHGAREVASGAALGIAYWAAAYRVRLQ